MVRIIATMVGLGSGCRGGGFDRTRRTPPGYGHVLYTTQKLYVITYIILTAQELKFDKLYGPIVKYLYCYVAHSRIPVPYMHTADLLKLFIPRRYDTVQ